MCSFPNITAESDELFVNLYRTHGGMFDEISIILGVDDFSELCPTNLLTHIGMDFAKQCLLQKKLADIHGIELMASDLEAMTIGRLYDLILEVQQFQNQLNRNRSKVQNQLLNFQLFIGSVENRIRLEYADTIMYEVITKSTRFNDTTCVILLPGLDNDTTKFVDMAHSISFATFIVKYGNKEMYVESFANEILRDINKLCQDKNTFHLVGYSFGSLIAIEIARALERVNTYVQVTCIDGSPLLFKRSFDGLMSNVDGENLMELELSTSIAQSFYTTRLPSLFRNELRRLTSWNGKVEWLTDLIRTLFLIIPDENFESVCRGVFNRTHAAAAYEFDRNRYIHSPITLIKSNTTIVYDITTDYGLKFCSNRFNDVKTFSGNHYTILDNFDIVNVINEIEY